MSALDPTKPLVRFEDRTRWAPFHFIADRDSRPVHHLKLPRNTQEAALDTTRAILRIIIKASK